MMMRALFFGLVVFLSLTFLTSGANDYIAIHNVTVIDATGEPPRSGTTVLIKNDRIADVAPRGGVAIPGGTREIDATGKFVIPGLWDMHVHWIDPPEFLQLYIANGVTNVRIMWGDALHHDWQKEIQKGKMIAPRPLIGSSLIDGMPPVHEGCFMISGAAEARRAVVAEKTNGAAFIKVYSRLARDEYMAIADESKKQKLPFGGHVPHSISAFEACRAGQKSIEHLTGILLACSSKEEKFRKEITASIQDDWKLSLRQAKQLLTTFDSKKAQQLYSLLAKYDTWQCPTLTVLRSHAFLNDPAFRKDDRIRYMPRDMETLWDPKRYQRYFSRTQEDEKNVRRMFQKQMQLVREMNRSKVPLIAGTDAGNPYCFPGFSLHDELGLLVKAGLTEMQALQAATRNAAEFSGKLDSLGTIEKGKIADLILLDDNPLKEISNTKKISAVIYGGRIFQQKQLQTMLAEVQKIATSPSVAETAFKTMEQEGPSATVKYFNKLKYEDAETYESAVRRFGIYGSFLLEQGDTDSAIELWEISAKIHPQSSGAFRRLASVYLLKGDKKSAMKYYQKALEVNPDDWIAREKLITLQSE